MIRRIFLYQRYIVYFIYCNRYLMVLVNVISVKMMVYTISYREICYTVDRNWYTVICAL